MSANSTLQACLVCEVVSVVCVCEYVNMLSLLKNLLMLYIHNLKKLCCRLIDLYDRGDQRNQEEPEEARLQ